MTTDLSQLSREELEARIHVLEAAVEYYKNAIENLKKILGNQR